MARIKALPPDVAAKIAAGEVVERPASVVKELVENAIDAGASAITVDVDEGGLGRIAVTDDGCGMDAGDAELAFTRYATSKISEESDLWKLATMGFRGEALHAIAAVGDVVVETRVAAALEGTRVEYKGGRPDVGVAGCPKGTRVEVLDLFHATPARKKFMKSSGVEFGHINAEVLRAALAHPSVAFEVSHNGKKVWSHPATSDPRERMRLLVSNEELDQLVEFDEEFEGMRVSGWVGSELMTRASAKQCHVYVNRRPVRDRLLMHGVTSGYGAALDRGRYPVAAVFVDVDPGTVDVNVHPTKREVRFANGPAVHDVIRAAINKALGQARQTRAFGNTAEMGDERWETGKPSCRQQNSFVCHPEPQAKDLAFDSAVHPESSIQNPASSLRVLGQFNSAFILCEDRDGTLVIIDQHAAHEKLGYQRLIHQYKTGQVEKQQLLFPQTMMFSSAEIAAFEQSAELFQRAGFDVGLFGEGDLVVTAVPAILGDIDVKALFEKMFAEIAECGSSDAIDEKIEHLFSVVACHAQVRAGDRLSIPEMQRLVDDIVRERVDSCPHGRPAIIRITRSEIDKWFKRS